MAAVPSPEILNNKLTKAHYDWLFTRGITQEVADSMRLFAATKFFHKLNRTGPAIGFPYYREGALVAAKYRSIEMKDFTQDLGGAHDFFGLERVVPGKPIVIVEGEIDCLTLMQCGIPNALSVPAGATVKVVDGKVQASEDKRFSFIWNAQKVLEAAPYVVIATDQDTPGQAMAEELARRIGKDRCRLAKFDKKDLNDVFTDICVDDPASNVKQIIEDAKPYPISGLSNASVYSDKIEDLFKSGTGVGHSTGYSCLDSLYTIAPGQLSIVTGYPSSGKSNFVDQIMVNLARGVDWKFAICSFENQPEIHITRLIELYTGKRFFEGTDRITPEEKRNALKWVDEHFLFIDNAGEEPDTLDSILNRARVAVRQMGVRGLVIDPYNYIEVPRGEGHSETANISDMLSKIVKFNKSHDVHTWFVAHPGKVTRTGMEQPRPDGMAISGSMAWWAKADCGITVHRRGLTKEVEIAVWKVRHRWIGSKGEAVLEYNKTAGNYTEPLDNF